MEFSFLSASVFLSTLTPNPPGSSVTSLVGLDAGVVITGFLVALGLNNYTEIRKQHALFGVVFKFNKHLLSIQNTVSLNTFGPYLF